MIRDIQNGVVHKKLAYEDEGKVSEENLTFAKSLLSTLDETDYDFLFYSHFAYKNKITEKADIETIEADFDYQDIEENGALYAYNDVLPYGDPLPVRMQGESCLIYDQYCLRSKCACTDTTLIFAHAGAGKSIRNAACKYRWAARMQQEFATFKAQKRAPCHRNRHRRHEHHFDVRRRYRQNRGHVPGRPAVGHTHDGTPHPL